MRVHGGPSARLMISAEGSGVDAGAAPDKASDKITAQSIRLAADSCSINYYSHRAESVGPTKRRFGERFRVASLPLPGRACHGRLRFVGQSGGLELSAGIRRPESGRRAALERVGEAW